VIVVWRITQHCNLRCPFCEWDQSLPRSRQHADPREVIRFARLLAGWQGATGRRVLVSWLGGEPLLWPELASVAAQVAALGVSQSTTTNGTTLDQPKARDLVLRHFTELTVSVDGFADFHDPMRGWSGGFDRLRDAVWALAARRASPSALRLRANVVLMRQNLHAFPDLCDALADWGIDEITFNALGGRDRPEFFPTHALRPDDVAWLRAALPALRARLAALGINLPGQGGYLDRFAATASGQPIAIDDCSPGREFLFIDEHGVIAPCDFTVAGYGVPTTAITTVDDLMALPARFAARKREQRAAACDDCRSTRVFAKFAA
jgi:MoaA/NifB/PqqE/SkfB family radical SAM enzyme